MKDIGINFFSAVLLYHLLTCLKSETRQAIIHKTLLPVLKLRINCVVWTIGIDCNKNRLFLFIFFSMVTLLLLFPFISASSRPILYSSTLYKVSKMLINKFLFQNKLQVNHCQSSFAMKWPNDIVIIWFCIYSKMKASVRRESSYQLKWRWSFILYKGVKEEKFLILKKFVIALLQRSKL